MSALPETLLRVRGYIDAVDTTFVDTDPYMQLWAGMCVPSEVRAHMDDPHELARHMSKFLGPYDDITEEIASEYVVLGLLGVMNKDLMDVVMRDALAAPGAALPRVLRLMQKESISDDVKKHVMEIVEIAAHIKQIIRRQQ